MAAGATWVNEACKAPNGCDDDGDGITICEEAGGTCENGACTAVDITSDNAALCNDAGGLYDSISDSCSVDITLDNAAICYSAGGTYDAVTDTCSGDTSGNLAAEQAGCEAANGTWDGSVCTPAAVADRDCFREGACGVDGWNYGPYEGVTVSSTGCADTAAGIDSYSLGEARYGLLRLINPGGFICYNEICIADSAYVCD